MCSGYTPKKLVKLLTDAITNRSPIKDVELVINAGAEVNAEVAKGLRAIHYATYINYTEAIELLIERGAEVDVQDEVGYSPIHIAAKHGHKEALRMLIEQGARVNFCEAEDASDVQRNLGYLTIDPLNLAVENNNPECVEILLLGGASPNHKYFLGHEVNLVPLEYTRCLEILLQYGADPDTVGRGGLSALMKACREQQVDAVKLLLYYGADPNVTPPYRFEQRTALHFAALSGNTEIARLLLEAGANTKRSEDCKYSIMEYAITQNKVEMCRLLAHFGADVNEANEDQISPLQITCSASSIKDRAAVLQILLEHGADVNYGSLRYSYDIPSMTGLVEYLSYHDEYTYDVIHVLLQYGARVNIRPSSHRFRVLDPSGILFYLEKIGEDDVFHLLVNAAVKFDVVAIRTVTSLTRFQRSVLLEVGLTPRPLVHLSRIAIQTFLGRKLPRKVSKLPLPQYLKSFIIYDV